MLRTISTVDRRISSVPTKAVTLAANTTADVVADSLTGVLSREEIAYIELFNAGPAVGANTTSANRAYYNYNADCDPGSGNFCGFLEVGTQLEVPLRTRVSMVSVAGTVIAVTILKRNTALGNNS